MASRGYSKPGVMARPAVNVIASGKAWQHGFIGGKKPIFANKP
jgi:hypothetical protein